MQAKQQLLKLALGLKPLSVKQYGEARKWKSVEGVKGRIWVLAHPEIPLKQLHIPMDSEIPGFGDAMLEVANRLSAIEERDLLSVLSDLHCVDSDVLRFRISSPDSRMGEVPFLDDIALREGAKKALLAAACSVVKPARHHPRMSRGPAEQLIKNCRSGQTEHGSYVIKIVCPLFSVEKEAPPLPTEEPFVRKATRLLMTATSRLIKGIEENSVDRVIEKDGTEGKSITWNLCDALLRMQPPDDGKLELKAQWGSPRDLELPNNTPACVAFPVEYFPVIEKVAGLLRPSKEMDTPQMFVGTVESLNGDVGEDGNRAGEVILSLLDREAGEALKARVNLDASMYELALQAHKQGLGYIRVCGNFQRGIRMGRIDHITDFRLLDDDTASLQPGT
jgi:hypothetical protein